MNKTQSKIAAYFMAALILTGGLAVSAVAQITRQFGKEVPVSVVGGQRSFPGTCFWVSNMVYNDDSLKKLVSSEQCSKMFGEGVIDLKKQTLIGWRAGGDCMMSAGTKLYRDDEKKLFTLVVENKYGGCRAGGWRQGMLLIDKIPADYNVKFIEYLVERNSVEVREKIGSGAIWAHDGKLVPPATAPSEPAATKTIDLETTEIDLKGCLRFKGSYQSAIKDDAALQEAIRQDASNETCRQELKKVDLDKYTLFGTHIVSDYCNRPPGLTHKIVRDDEKKTYTFQVRYDLSAAICRRIGQYDLWVLAPKVPSGYETTFEIQAPDRGNN